MHLIDAAVLLKFSSPEAKEVWYTKLSRVRKMKCVKLSVEQDFKCFYCERECWLTPDQREGASSGDKAWRLGATRSATLEHLTPQSQGGTDSLKNLVMACHKCNSDRGVMPWETFLEMRRDPEKWADWRKTRAHAKSERDTDRSVRSDNRYTKKAAELAVLFFHFPNLIIIFDEAVAALGAEAQRKKAYFRDRDARMVSENMT